MNDCNGTELKFESINIESTGNENGTQNHSSSYPQLLEAGLSVGVANALDAVFKEDLVKFSDLDDRAIEALKELDEDGALAVLKQFNDSNLQHVQNKSAFLCGVMKIHRQRAKHEKDGLAPEVKRSGPAEEKIQELLERTKYSLDVTTGQRRYGGPPPKEIYDGDEPGPGCQVFVGRIPRTVFEDELVPLLEDAGIIWDFRLMMDPLTGQNRGFGFVTYTSKESAVECVKKLDNYEIKPKKYLGVCVSQSNCRLFVGSIPKTKTKDEIYDEFNELTKGLKDVIIYLQTEDKLKNRGFCFLEYVDHKAASQARRKLGSPKVKAFNNAISVDWADPIEEPSDEIMSKVKVLYIKNLSIKASEEIVMTTFSTFGEVERVKKIKDYAFVHFKERDDAMKALEGLNGLNLEGEPIEISLAKPVDKKKKERQMERKMMNTPYGMNIGGYGGGPRNTFMGRGRGGRGGMSGFGGPPMMGGYGGNYVDDFYTSDYMHYGFGGYDDPFYGAPMRGGHFQQRQGMMRGNQRGMYGGGYVRGRGGAGGGNNQRGRSRGGRGGGSGNNSMRGRGKPNMPGKRKANFGNAAPVGGKRQNMSTNVATSSGQWGSEPIAQQPLHQEAGAEWFQDSIDEQWS
ncbi:heterogeneous nuclear ribonucleoprotein Q-like [Clavelina lepadiformis]|uniref:heterogeneous nuclear ribonucleoprotein Q-like n=1 Tax=Clavelina lepadiformis TaxID=159417 RepID=UPI0040413358